MVLVFDSYAWIEFFSGSEAGERVKELLVAAEAIHTPSVVLLEIANKYFREGFSLEVVEERLSIVEKLSIIEPINRKYLLGLKKAQKILNENAKKLGLRSRPSMVDYLVLAMAMELGAKVVTGDNHFKNLSITVGI